MNYRKKLIRFNLHRNLIIIFLVCSLGVNACRPTKLPAPTVGTKEVVQEKPTTTATIALASTKNNESAPVSETPPLNQQQTPIPTGTIMQISLASTTPVPTASPTPCPLPTGWIIYTIQPGDTLSTLANLTDVKLEDLMAANCLTNDFIKAYEQLYLPKRPPVVVLPPPPAPTTAPRCPSIFSCPKQGVDPLPIASGGGNDPTFKPCTDGNPGSYLTFEGEKQTPKNFDWPVGQQLYLFACGFSHPEKLMVTISGPNFNQNLEVLELAQLPNRDLITNSSAAKRVIPWYPECDNQIGAYTITASDSVDVATKTINLYKDNIIQRIMARPQTIHSGDVLQIFYCNYAPGSTFQVNLRIKTGIDASGDTIFDPFNSWPVTVNTNGWYIQTDITEPDAQPGEYYIIDEPSSLKGEDKLWVLP